MQGAPGSSTLESSAPGSLVLVREEERLVTHVDQTRDGTLITCQGLSKFVAGTTAQFFEGLATPSPFDPYGVQVISTTAYSFLSALLERRELGEATLSRSPPSDDRCRRARATISQRVRGGTAVEERRLWLLVVTCDEGPLVTELHRIRRILEPTVISREGHISPTGPAGHPGNVRKCNVVENEGPSLPASTKGSVSNTEVPPANFRHDSGFTGEVSRSVPHLLR